ncbi:MAG TPA: hypothetical protein VFG38_09905 [Pseudomonadales bacterium]|nr:hypothetical protein [Pseudomonadales bacterium]
MRQTLALLGAVQLLNGLYMIVAPMAWYGSVPGVVDTGPMNHHFIIDIGLAFAASGVGMSMALRRGAAAAAFALAGATWPTLHALFHVSGWIQHGMPSDTRDAITQFIGVMVVSFGAFALAWVLARREGAI